MEITDAERYKHEETIRQMMRAEDDLANQRMNWMASLNGLLFAALGFAWGKADTRFLERAVCLLGIWVSAMTLVALYLSSRSQRALLQWWQQNRPQKYFGPGVMGAAPVDTKRLLLMFVPPWTLIAFGLLVCWISIAWFVYHH